MVFLLWFLLILLGSETDQSDILMTSPLAMHDLIVLNLTVLCKLVVSLQMQNRKATDKINEISTYLITLLLQSSAFAFCN